MSHPNTGRLANNDMTKMIFSKNKMKRNKTKGE